MNAWRLRRPAGPAGRPGGDLSNLHRLAEEYRRTEKRARALENVLLPEVSDRLKRINEHLETFEQEEAIRARLAAGKL